MPSIKIETLGGNCPVQGEGQIDAKPFYFRARGNRWTLSIGGDPVGNPDWFYEEPYGDTPFAAGWMSLEEAREFIHKGADIFRKDAAA